MKINLENVRNGRSAWAKGVKLYVEELLETLEYYDNEPANKNELRSMLLNGANSWSNYSWGGCSLIYNYDIANRLCNKSELERTQHGAKRPNSTEEWLDVQARALYQACELILSICEF